MLNPTSMSAEKINDKILLAEAKSLVAQLFARGDFVNGGTTERQVQDLVNKINRALYA